MKSTPAAGREQLRRLAAAAPRLTQGQIDTLSSLLRRMPEQQVPVPVHPARAA